VRGDCCRYTSAPTVISGRRPRQDSMSTLWVTSTSGRSSARSASIAPTGGGTSLSTSDSRALETPLTREPRYPYPKATDTNCLHSKRPNSLCVLLFVFVCICHTPQPFSFASFNTAQHLILLCFHCLIFVLVRVVE
jgi:hypothetical protein